MLDTTAWPGNVDNYVDALVWLVGELLTDPKHFFRSFTVKELGRLMTVHTLPNPRSAPTRWGSTSAAKLARGAGVETVVDVRRYPAS